MTMDGDGDGKGETKAKGREGRLETGDGRHTSKVVTTLGPGDATMGAGRGGQSSDTTLLQPPGGVSSQSLSTLGF